MIDISIILPVYNTEEYLEECMDSILNQKGPSVEIICINDGSTDGSLDILRQYQNAHPDTITIVNQENAGISAARNKGISMAKGKYLYFIDSDDYLNEDALQSMFSFAEGKKLDVLFFSFNNICDDILLKKQYGHMLKKEKRTHEYTEVVDGKQLFAEFMQHDEYYCTVWSQLYRSEFINNNNIRFPEGIFYEDQLFTYYVLSVAERAWCVNKKLYNKRIRPGSIVTEHDNDLYIDGMINTVLMISRLIDKEDIDKEFYKASTQLIVRLKNGVLKTISKIPRSQRHDYCQRIIQTIIEYSDRIGSSNVPLVSLCIPTNGVGKWLFPVLDSIYASGEKDFLYEVIVTINNECDQLFVEILENYQRKNPNLNVFYNNSGMFMNEIESYKKAKGEMVKFINHRTVLKRGALSAFLTYAFLLKEKKPVIYFGNGMLEIDEFSVFYDFDHFLSALGIWSSWSTGMCFFKGDYQSPFWDSNRFNQLFPHTDILFRYSHEKEYLIDNEEYLLELPTGNSPKGKYDVFYAFGVVFYEIIMNLYKDRRIIYKTKIYMMEQILEYIAFLYHGFVLNKKSTSYNLDGYETAVSVYFSDQLVQKCIDKKYPCIQRPDTECRYVAVEIIDESIIDVYNWKNLRCHYLKESDDYVSRNVKVLKNMYKFVRVDIVPVLDTDFNENEESIQEHRLNAYLDDSVTYVSIKDLGNKENQGQKDYSYIIKKRIKKPVYLEV